MGYQRQSLAASSEIASLASLLDIELEKVEAAIAEARTVPSLHVEPAKPREGMIVIADGTDWDPGDGPGQYTYINGVWVKAQDAGDYQAGSDILDDIANGEWDPANGLELTGSNLQMTENQRLISIPFHINGGLVVPTTGLKGVIGPIAFAHEIVGAYVVGDHATGDVVIDVWRDVFTDYPIDNTDSITASAPLTIVNSNKVADTTLTGWSKTAPALSMYGFNIDSISDFLWLTVTLVVLKT